MKRLNKTTIALVTAGALGLGTMPFAEAQEPRNTEGVHRATDQAGDLNANDIFGGATTPAPETYIDRQVPTEPLPAGLSEQATGEAVVGEKSTEGSQWVTDQAPANPAEATNINQLTGTAEPSTANSWDRPKTTGTVTETLRPPATTTENNITAIVLGTLGALVGLGLIIGGVKYFVNKDGDLVKDPNRVNEPATPAEKAESDKLKKDHAQEIAKQVEAQGGTDANGAKTNANAVANDGTAATGERGMNASTGVTQLPAGLVALLVLSIIGAAGYAFTRRETV